MAKKVLCDGFFESQKIFWSKPPVRYLKETSLDSLQKVFLEFFARCPLCFQTLINWFCQEMHKKRVEIMFVAGGEPFRCFSINQYSVLSTDFFTLPLRFSILILYRENLPNCISPNFIICISYQPKKTNSLALLSDGRQEKLNGWVISNQHLVIHRDSKLVSWCIFLNFFEIVYFLVSWLFCQVFYFFTPFRRLWYYPLR